MNGPTAQRLWKYASQCLGLKSHFRSPGDGRVQAQIPARALLGALLWGQLRRRGAFLAVARLGAFGGAAGCPLCRLHKNPAGQITAYRHHLVRVAVVGSGFCS